MKILNVQNAVNCWRCGDRIGAGWETLYAIGWGFFCLDNTCAMDAAERLGSNIITLHDIFMGTGDHDADECVF